MIRLSTLEVEQLAFSEWKFNLRAIFRDLLYSNQKAFNGYLYNIHFYVNANNKFIRTCLPFPYTILEFDSSNKLDEILKNTRNNNVIHPDFRKRLKEYEFSSDFERLI